jgi:BirA family biotin operon repressor/biotin-[acetyl-CoA-carboxylase] ligase
VSARAAGSGRPDPIRTPDQESTLRIGSELFRADRVDSTMRWARDALERGRAGPGAVFVAAAQTAGRGRHGRSWLSAPGKGLYLTLVLPGELAAPCVTLVAALGAAEAVDRRARVRPRLKWPNDLVVGGRKLGGLLAEVASPPAGPAVLLGLGLNVLHETGDFGPELARTATSLRMEGVIGVTPDDLLPEALERMEVRLDQLAHGGFGAVADAYLARAAFAPGDRLELARREGETWLVTFVGLDEEGRLLVRESLEPLSSAEVLRIRPRGGES